MHCIRPGWLAVGLVLSSLVPLAAQADVACGTANISNLRSRIYVAPGGSDGPNCGGTVADACASIQQGIGRCAAADCGVLVRYGRYETTATTTLRNGVGVYGGCVFNGAGGQRYRTIVDAAPAAGTPAISADAINTATTIYGLVVIGKNETAAGTASLAMTVSNSSGLTIASTVLSSGTGGPGTGGGSASAVGAGGIGSSANPNLWGWSGVGGNSCPSNHTTDDGTGGLAGTSLQPAFNACASLDAEPGGASGSVPGGAFGKQGSFGIWCPTRPHDQPGDGGVGQPGGAGLAGAQAMASPLIGGTLVGTAWQASKGDDGKTAAVGSGGGGGGPGGSCMYFNGYGAYQGFAGGAGGGGGCGGAAGTGGQQGGASIPLILSSTSQITWNHISIIPGAGGGGGKGGDSVSGGAGGAGGNGIQSGQVLFWARWCPGLSGAGGAGGPGGAGSGAAGGNGGPSIGVALVNSTPGLPPDSQVYPSLPGAGGMHGNGGPAATLNGISVPAGPDGQDGQTGLAADWFRYQ